MGWKKVGNIIVAPYHEPDHYNRVLTNRAYYNDLTINDRNAQARVYQACSLDIVFFVNNFCWCFEPRDNKEFPIVLYHYQEFALRSWVQHLDFEQGDILIEKCRDMGITWTILYLYLWYWLFRPRSDFLIGSFREQEIDYQDSMSSLFPKLRFVIDKLPYWLVPKGYVKRVHATWMRLYNPENKSIIVGSAPVANFGRSARYKSIFFDELPQWPFQQSSWDASSQSSRNRFANGTPWGPDNCFAHMALDPDNVRIEIPQLVLPR